MARRLYGVRFVIKNETWRETNSRGSEVTTSISHIAGAHEHLLRRTIFTLVPGEMPTALSKDAGDANHKLIIGNDGRTPVTQPCHVSEVSKCTTLSSGQAPVSKEIV